MAVMVLLEVQANEGTGDELVANIQGDSSRYSGV